MIEKQRPDVDDIQPGMEVEDTRGDLGEEDVSKPKVIGVVRNKAGHVEEVIVKKGIIFQKELDIPIDRVQEVDEASSGEEHGKIKVDLSEAELEQLTAVGAQEVAHEESSSLLDEVERAIPTAESVREAESLAVLKQQGLVPEEEQPKRKGLLANPLFRLLGPGFLGGMAGNDSSAVTAYSIDGAQNGFGHLWLLLLSTPMYQSVMYTCAKIGRVTQQGLADILREHYGRWVAILATVVLIVSNIALITADLAAIGSGFELITGISWFWFVVPVGAILWYLTVFRNFDTIKQVFLVLSLAFLVYFVTGILAKPSWSSILFNTFVPHIDIGFTSISSAVALLGATISPYVMFWQVQGEKEESRAGNAKQQMRTASADVGVGVFSGNLIAYFMIITTAATLFKHNKDINTAADAATALTAVLGPFAKYLFALGLIGAGVVAIPVLLASTSYAVAGTFGWPYGLSKKPWQNEGFYLILSGALIVSLALALLRLDPIQLMFWANVLMGVLSPILVVYLIILANNRKVMRGQRVGWFVTTWLVITFLVMTAAAVLLLYGLATGQTSS